MKYIGPTTTAIEMYSTKIMVASEYVPNDKKCDSQCKIYHYCVDRKYGEWCPDKRRY